MTIPTIGDRLIEADFYDLEGGKHNLKDFNNKFILLNFWSLTCLICMKSAKDLRMLHENHRDKLNIISINLDNTKSMWEQGTSRDNISWINLSDGLGCADGIGKTYGIVSFPSYLLIDRNNLIIDRFMGYKPGRFEEKIKEHRINI